MTIALLGAGGSPHITRLAETLTGRGHRVHIISEARHGPFPELPGIEFLLYDNRLPFFQRIAQVRNLLRTLAPDVLHSHYVNVGGFVGVASLFHPHVMTAWGNDIFVAPTYSRAQYLKTVFALRTADYVLSPSKALQSKMVEMAGILRHNDVIQWGVDTTVFRPASAAQTRRDLGWPQDPIVYSPRALDPLYNQDVLLRAWPLVKLEIQNARLMLKRLNPDPDFEKSLLLLASELGIESDISWLEPTTYQDLPRHFQASDVVVSIPSSDGTPTTMLEALACGKPVVACDLQTIRDWIIEDIHGKLVDPKNPKALAAAIVAMLRLSPESQAQMTAVNRKLVEVRAGVEANTSRLEAIYQSLGPKKGFSPTRSLVNSLRLVF